MIERMTTKTNKNGNALQVEIDHEARTVERGYYLFRRDSDTITATKSDIDRYGDLSNGKGYCYWNKSGNRNDRAAVYCEYKFDANGRAI